MLLLRGVTSLLVCHAASSLLSRPRVALAGNRVSSGRDRTCSILSPREPAVEHAQVPRLFRRPAARTLENAGHSEPVCLAGRCLRDAHRHDKDASIGPVNRACETLVETRTCFGG
jgi:hypothetical protein